MGHRGEARQEQGEVEGQHGCTLPAPTRPQQDRHEAACELLPGRRASTSQTSSAASPRAAPRNASDAFLKATYSFLSSSTSGRGGNAAARFTAMPVLTSSNRAERTWSAATVYRRRDPAKAPNVASSCGKWSAQRMRTRSNGSPDSTSPEAWHIMSWYSSVHRSSSIIDSTTALSLSRRYCLLATSSCRRWFSSSL
jgi:hypothetical protein